MPKGSHPVWKSEWINWKSEYGFVSSWSTICETIARDASGASDPISKIPHERPKENQQEILIPNHIGNPSEILYYEFLQAYIPRNINSAGQDKDEWFMRLHCPTIRHEGYTWRIIDKEKRSNNSISELFQYVHFNQTHKNNKIGEILLKKIYRRIQEDHEPLPRAHTCWNYFNLDFLIRGSITDTKAEKMRKKSYQ